MSEYTFTKTDAHAEVLKREIEESSITTPFDRIVYNEPSDLKIYFTGSLTSEEETTLNSLVTAHDGTGINFYRGWCDECSAAFEYYGKSFPATCPLAGCEDYHLTDITNDVVAYHGWAVRQDDQTGYYEWWIPGGNHRRYSKHRTFIAYDSRLTYTPTITLGMVIYDGMSDLRVLFAGREGFVVESTVVQTKKRFGGLNVKFTWSGAPPE